MPKYAPNTLNARFLRTASPRFFGLTRRCTCVAVWEPMYNPTPEQAEKDRAKAYETGIPHGYVPPGDKYAGQETIRLQVKSDLVSTYT